MDLTKRELARSAKDFYISLAHGYYSKFEGDFIVPQNLCIFFLSKASRTLPQAIVTSEFYEFLGYFGGYKRMMKDARIVKPPIFEGIFERFYGPGDQCPNLKLAYMDDAWPGMGVHKLPIPPGTFKTTPGVYNGRHKTLRAVACKRQVGPAYKRHFINQKFEEPTVLFVMSCRETTQVYNRIYNQNSNIEFMNNTQERKLANRNVATSRLTKRRRSNNSNNSVSPKRRRLSNTNNMNIN